jgi:hypothetical protein
MSQKGFEKPFKLHAEKDVFKRQQKIDLVLGDDGVLVEIKVEPDYPGVNKPVVFSTIQEASGSGGSVEEDLKKIKNYAEKGKHAHFIMLDEDGRHAKKILGNWNTLDVKGKRSYLLHVYNKPQASQS